MNILTINTADPEVKVLDKWDGCCCECGKKGGIVLQVSQAYFDSKTDGRIEEETGWLPNGTPIMVDGKKHFHVAAAMQDEDGYELDDRYTWYIYQRPSAFV